jgi:hypothetical protein
MGVVYHLDPSPIVRYRKSFYLELATAVDGDASPEATQGAIINAHVNCTRIEHNTVPGGTYIRTVTDRPEDMVVQVQTNIRSSNAYGGRFIMGARVREVFSEKV